MILKGVLKLDSLLLQKEMQVYGPCQMRWRFWFLYLPSSHLVISLSIRDSYICEWKSWPTFNLLFQKQCIFMYILIYIYIHTWSTWFTELQLYFQFSMPYFCLFPSDTEVFFVLFCFCFFPNVYLKARTTGSVFTRTAVGSLKSQNGLSWKIP